MRAVAGGEGIERNGAPEVEHPRGKLARAWITSCMQYTTPSDWDGNWHLEHTDRHLAMHGRYCHLRALPYLLKVRGSHPHTLSANWR